MKIAVYPGTFNPITNGHTDLVERAARLFDKIIVAVGTNRQKSETMQVDQRVALAEEVLGHLENVEVTSFDSLLTCLLYTSPSPRDATLSRMPSSA